MSYMNWGAFFSVRQSYRRGGMGRGSIDDSQFARQVALRRSEGEVMGSKNQNTVRERNPFVLRQILNSSSAANLFGDLPTGDMLNNRCNGEGSPIIKSANGPDKREYRGQSEN
jgi:hypothetical protein